MLGPRKKKNQENFFCMLIFRVVNAYPLETYLRTLPCRPYLRILQSRTYRTFWVVVVDPIVSYLRTLSSRTCGPSRVVSADLPNRSCGTSQVVLRTPIKSICVSSRVLPKNPPVWYLRTLPSRTCGPYLAVPPAIFRRHVYISTENTSMCYTSTGHKKKFKF